MKQALKYAAVYGLGYTFGGLTAGVWLIRVFNGSKPGSIRSSANGHPYNRYSRGYQKDRV